MRDLKTILLLIIVVCAWVVPVQAAEMGDDGLHKQDWFVTTFRDIREDIQTAREEGKRLAIIIEQRGCIYCDRLHEKVLSDPEVAKYISENFMVVQYNMFGDEEVTDLDGEELSEKKAVRKWRLNFTPTIVFLPDRVDENSKDVGAVSVAVLPGAFGKWTTLNMFKWVREKIYLTDEPFQKFHARLIEAKRAAGKL